MSDSRNFTLEERMDRAGTDDVQQALAHRRDVSGLSFKKLGRGLKRGLKKVGKGLSSSVRKFVPGRDVGKAKMIKALNAKLVREHANFLHVQDLKRGIKRPHALYVSASQPWAKAQIQRAGLPVSFSSTAGDLTDICGAVFIGTWWNPVSWFKRKTKYVLVNTEGQRLAELSEGDYANFRAQQDQQNQQAEGGAPTPEEAAAQFQDDAGPEPEAPDEESGMSMGKLYRSIHDPLEDFSGIDVSDEDAAFIFGDNDSDDSDDDNAFVFGEHLPDLDQLAYVWGADASHGESYDRAVERNGDDRFGRHARRVMSAAGANAFIGSSFIGRHHKKRRHQPKKPAEARKDGGEGKARAGLKAAALEQMIARQLPTRVVSAKLVCHWAHEQAKSLGRGKDEAKRLAKWQKDRIEKAGGALSQAKSETAGCL